MKKSLYFLFAFVVSMPLIIYGGLQESNSKAKMVGNLQIIQNIFEDSYAPSFWKKQLFDWDLKQEIHQAQREILALNSPCVDQYQTILRNFFTSTCDHHVNVLFHNKAMSFLLFDLIQIDNRYIVINSLDFPSDEENDEELTLEEKEMKKSLDIYSKLKIGDEVIAINDEPIEEVFNRFKKNYFKEDSLTNQRFAEIFFTKRFAYTGMNTPKGKISLKIKNQNGAIHEYETTWLHLDELIEQPKQLGLKKDSIYAYSKLPFLKKKMCLPIFEWQKNCQNELSAYLTKNFCKDCKAIDHPFSIGKKDSSLPPLGKILFKTDESYSYDAYLFELENGKVGGFIRIPNYMLGEEQNISEWQELISIFEQQSDFLVIDQLNNPGGSMFCLYGILSYLTDKPMQVPAHRISLTQAEIVSYVDILQEIEILEEAPEEEIKEALGDSIEGYNIDRTFIKDLKTFCLKVLDQWRNGKTLTDPLFLYGVKNIYPNPKIHYSKPIYVLINELDISCADFFPAVLQDNNRATLIGTGTSGAGGYVNSVSFPNKMGVAAFSYTGSLALRKNNKPIENLGVTPDIPYTLTQEDLTNNLIDYNAFIKKLLLKS